MFSSWRSGPVAMMAGSPFSPSFASSVIEGTKTSFSDRGGYPSGGDAIASYESVWLFWFQNAATRYLVSR
jgi:hypothetical protein